MDYERVLFSGHAVQRMFERGIGKADVLSVLADGKVVAKYPDDAPYPTCLMLGFAADQPLHVLVARDDVSQTCYVVTVYVPDLELWDSDFKTRRSP